ncbi:carbon-nitrogen hydrolase family protein [Ruicaihuangia caeni]|uniref:Carbon-nitrogen hydrolase family protein n=1 Tax=Ruicaihuangia caeni TaxID=3042517 RepID=A0AAW6T7H7_9MICO|nr:carbon-nitrogen hydrolase family protein [Klugiella sp. YN-L-19]MDI2098651.1 carbon-nitrogen hydrolase family protein [Klugiella sp. YN-L-19]
MVTTRIAVAQFESTAEVQANRDKMVALTKEAAAGGADLVMFHELATTDYFCYDDEESKHFALAEPVPGPSTDALLEAARSTGVAVLLPLYEVDAATRYNTVVYLDPERGILGKYRKTHIPVLGATNGQKGANEGFYFDAGDTGFVLPGPIAGLSTGSAICYDRHFPESGRAYAMQGAHLLFVPTASYRDSIIKEIWKAELQTFAFQNSIYVAGVNKIGPVLGDGVKPGSRYPGGSVIFSPEGRVLAECGDGEEIAYADVDAEHCERVRAGAMNFLNARQPQHYGLLVSSGAE